jgi:hypothetical protein
MDVCTPVPLEVELTKKSKVTISLSPGTVKKLRVTAQLSGQDQSALVDQALGDLFEQVEVSSGLSLEQLAEEHEEKATRVASALRKEPRRPRVIQGNSSVLDSLSASPEALSAETEGGGNEGTE